LLTGDDRHFRAYSGHFFLKTTQPCLPALPAHNSIDVQKWNVPYVLAGEHKKFTFPFPFYSSWGFSPRCEPKVFGSLGSLVKRPNSRDNFTFSANDIEK
jgi:hypothetical protein